jgi:prepilin-type N-terminal cleavage/methylation domain-containing protein
MQTITVIRGYTLLEVLIAITVIAILSVAGIGYFRSSIVQVAAGSTMKSFVADIKAARGRAMAGDRGESWGVRAIPVTETWEFYATGTRSYAAEAFMTETRTLPVGVSWIDPSIIPKRIEFTPITGMTTTTTFILGYGTVRLQVVVDGAGGVMVTQIGG